MAKYDEREGNSCHIHIVAALTGRATPVLAGDGPDGFSPLMEHFLAGQLAAPARADPASSRRTSTPTSASSPGSFAPDRGRLGPRQPHLRAARRRPRPVAAGREPGAGRRRQPLPGRRRADRRRPRTASSTSCRSSRRSSATPTTSDKPPRAVDAARRRRAVRRQRPWRAAAFGDEVVDHYVNAARVELAAFDAAVTDWERFRGFERL